MASSASASNLRRLARPRRKELPFEIDQVWVDRAVADHPQAIRILNRLGDVPIDLLDDVRLLKRPRELSDAKRWLLLTMHRGEAFKPCQGMTAETLCCNYRVIDLVSGCPMDCSYCVLQDYLANNPVMTAFVNVETILAQVAAFLAAHPNRFFRIGTGELSDSLALDPITEYASVLIPFFASKRNALLELKTKTAAVDHLLNLRHRNRTVISWSLNTEAIIASEERGTASLEERLAAAQRCAQAGFGVGFHFDPIILTRGLDDVALYLDVIQRIFAAVEPRQIAWVSLGCLRYPPTLAAVSQKRFPRTAIFSGELVPAGNKMRYLRFLREAALKALWEKLSEKLPPRKLSLCMETKPVWEKVDPSVASNACIEKRLCNAEAISFDYRA